MCTAITRGDPASMGFYRTRMDSRVKHGNDREWRGVMPPCVILLHGVIRHPCRPWPQRWIPVSSTGMTGSGEESCRT
ncbi:MAG: hypothetical protein ISR54_06110 [Chlorobium phaeobacteroides]|nr:hypothetical protein [Chlorobium phaeobacteroides]